METSMGLQCEDRHYYHGTMEYFTLYAGRLVQLGLLLLLAVLGDVIRKARLTDKAMMTVARERLLKPWMRQGQTLLVALARTWQSTPTPSPMHDKANTALHSKTRAQKVSCLIHYDSIQVSYEMCRTLRSQSTGILLVPPRARNPVE